MFGMNAIVLRGEGRSLSVGAAMEVEYNF